MPAAKKPAIDLAARGAHVLSVYGPFNSRTLVEMRTELAMELFPDGLGAARRALVIEAAERDVALIRARSAELGDSAIAASAVAMAYEIEHPYNSATSKSMCQGRLVDAMDRLRELAPPVEQPKDGLDDISARRALRLASSGGPASSNP